MQLTLRPSLDGGVGVRRLENDKVIGSTNLIPHFQTAFEYSYYLVHWAQNFLARKVK